MTAERTRGGVTAMVHLRKLSAAMLAACVLGVGWLAAQPPRKEEEEEPVKGARPAVPVPVADPPKKDDVPAAPVGDVGSFKEEMAKADKAGHPAGRDLFNSLTVPYDLLTANFDKGRVYRIELLPHRDLPDGEFMVQRLDVTLRNSTEMKIVTGTGYKYTPYELIVLEQVEKFLQQKTTLDRSTVLDYAARAVASGLRWHRLAVDHNKRLGKQWELVAAEMKAKHLSLVRERFNLLVDSRAYAAADDVGLKMLARYPDNSEVMRDVYRLQLIRVRATEKAPTDAELLRVREALVLYEQLPGIKDDGLIAAAKKQLRARAGTLVADAKALDAQKMTAAALAKLREAELIDPDAPGIGEVRTTLRGKVLYVGVPRLPERMSPATAETDAEKWAVELMFEGLLQTVPDTEVVRYRPVLAEAMPGVMPLGRSFSLPKDIRFSREAGGTLDARDVRGTLDLLRRPALADKWASVGIDVFEQIDRVEDPFRLRLAYRHGVLEPLSRATFKVLPAQYLQTEGKTADDDAFARAPFGTGPFRYEGREREANNREVAVFRSNPFYGQRAGRFGLPWIRELRMCVPTASGLPADVAAGQLHLYPDCPADLVPRIRGDAGIKETLKVHTAAVNRRIHLLAINHRQGPLQSDKLRQGLSAAINREAILKEVFRPGLEKAHAALTGPFPPNSWATPETAKTAELHKPGAGGLIAEALNDQAIRLRLAFNSDDANAAKVAQLMEIQLEQAAVSKAGKLLVDVIVVPMAPEQFRVKLNLEHDYDLALTTFDYRDDLYSLASLFDPEAAGKGGRNFLGYLASGTNPGEGDRRLKKLIDDIRQHRDFTREIKDRTWDVHALFNQRVPFVPLWQLDRFMVVHRELDLFLEAPDAPVSGEKLDPAVVFTGVEMWRLK